MSEQAVYTLFQGKFKEIYADLIVVLGSKPGQIVFEIEAAFTHIAVGKTQPAIAIDNYNKALGHVQRATLDAAKMLWIEYKTRLNKYLNDDGLRTFCCNASEVDFIKSYEKAESLAQEARKDETVNVGINPEASIEKYYEAALEFKKCLGMIDGQKEKKFQTFRFVHKIKEFSISFLLGATASALVSYLFFYVPNPTAGNNAHPTKEVTAAQPPTTPVAVAESAQPPAKPATAVNAQPKKAKPPQP